MKETIYKSAIRKYLYDASAGWPPCANDNKLYTDEEHTQRILMSLQQIVKDHAMLLHKFAELADNQSQVIEDNYHRIKELERLLNV